MSDSNDEAIPAYVGRCKTCHGVLGAIVDDGESPKETAKFVAQFVRRGCPIERVTVGWVRTEARGRWCTCDKRKMRSAPSAPEEPRP